MARRHKKDTDRFLISMTVAVILHLVFFTGLQFFLNIKIEALPEYTGPLYMELGDEFDNETIADESQENQTQIDKTQADENHTDTRRDESASTAIIKDNEQVEKDWTSDQTEEDIYPQTENAEHSLPENEDSDNNITDTVADNSVTEDNKLQPTPGPTASPTPYDPALEQENLSQLDRLLENGASSNTSSSGKTADNNSSSTDDITPLTGDGGPQFEWADNKNRSPLKTYEPEIPEWVSRQGLRLTIKVSFWLRPEGFLTDFDVYVSSGYPDVDLKIVEALRKWRFPSVSGTENVHGQITYYIGIK